MKKENRAKDIQKEIYKLFCEYNDLATKNPDNITDTGIILILVDKQGVRGGDCMRLLPADHANMYRSLLKYEEIEKSIFTQGVKFQDES